MPFADVTTLGIFHAKRRTVRIAEIEFSQVTRQMLVAAMLIYAAHAALEDRKETFNRVRWRDWIADHNIFEGGDLGQKRYEQATVSVM